MKLVQKRKEVDCKVNLPKDFQWKVLKALLTDLETNETDEGLMHENPLGLSVDERKLLDHAIRMRDHGLLRMAVSAFNPRSMVKEDLGRRVSTFFARYQVSSFLKKYPDKGIDTRAKAFEKFRKVERHCALYNKENHKAIVGLSNRHPDYFGILEDIKDDILKLLGETPNLALIYGLSRHGPGATVDSKQHDEGKTTQYYKWSLLPYTVTADARVHVQSAIIMDPRWIAALMDWYREKFSVPMTRDICFDHFWKQVFKVVNGSRTTSVPKTSEEDRTIALEPTGNVFVQLGVDGFVRARLKKRWKIDLDDQTLNQDLAEQGSIDGSIATIDLSAASDCVTMILTWLLFPVGWYDLLCNLRSPVTEIEGEEIVLEKLSSMGNGYTFAIESVVFASVVRTVMKRARCKGPSSVYGDDIIVPVECASGVIDLLQLFGFKTNVDKTFVDGPFRESCGTDWIHGFNVRPVFLTKPIKNVLDLFYIHNALWALQDRLHWTLGFDFTLTRALIRKAIPKNIRNQFYGPPSENLDSYLFSHKKTLWKGSGLRVHWAIKPRAVRYNKEGSNFLFRKLMVSLKGGTKSYIWDRRKLIDTGNAFDITRRDRVHYVCALAKAWSD